MSEQRGQQPQDQPEQGQTPSAFPQYPQQQYPAAPPLGGGFGGAAFPAATALPGQPYGPPRTSKLAISSLILGIISLRRRSSSASSARSWRWSAWSSASSASWARPRRTSSAASASPGSSCACLGIIGGGLVTVAALHAANACKAIDKNDTTAYNDCIRNNLKL